MIGIQGQDLGYVIRMGILMALVAMLALLFGALAGKVAAPRREPATRRICATTFFIRCRAFLLRISTTFPHPAW